MKMNDIKRHNGDGSGGLGVLNKQAQKQNKTTENRTEIRCLPVAAAASEPSSLTSMNALCTTSDTYNGSGDSNRPLKSAFPVNISAMPIYTHTHAHGRKNLKFNTTQRLS